MKHLLVIWLSCNYDIEDKDDDADEDENNVDYDIGDNDCFKGLGLAIFTVVGITLLVVKLQPKAKDRTSCI